MTAGEYTERLALQFSEMQQDWREKAQELERELLRTRQELARFQVQAEGIGHSYITRRGVCVYVCVCEHACMENCIPAKEKEIQTQPSTPHLCVCVKC